jgi:hypothetical protein
LIKPRVAWNSNFATVLPKNQYFHNQRSFLKAGGNKKGGGLGGWQTCEDGFRTMAIDVSLFFNFVVVFSSTYFRFRLVKPSK